MSRSVSVALAVGALTWVMDASAEAPLVVSIHAPSMDWPAARNSVEAELRAAGFHVAEAKSAAVDPASLLAELAPRAAEHPNGAGSVTVMRVGSTGIAYVWLAEQRHMFRVDAPPSEPEIAAGVLSLRVADLMAVRPWDEPAVPRDSTAPPSQATPDAAATTWLWFGGGPALGSGLGTPGVQMILGANFPLASMVSLDLAAAMSAAPSTAYLPEGSVSVRHRQLGAHVLLDVVAKPRWTLALGAGAGGLCLQAQGKAEGSALALRDATCVGIATLRARGLVRWGRALLWTMVEPGLTFPTVQLRTDDRTGTMLGRPWASASVGVGWSL